MSNTPAENTKSKVTGLPPARHPTSSLKNATARYGVVAQFMHWFVAVLVVIQFILGVSAHNRPISIERLVLLSRHKSIGLTIGVLMILRLLWRWHSPPPSLPSSVSASIRAAAGFSHGSMYVLLILMPLIGWASSSAANLTVSFFGLFALPNFVTPDKQLSHILVTIHITLGWILFSIIVVHISAAFWHQFHLRDGTLMRMLPFRNKRGRGSSA